MSMGLHTELEFENYNIAGCSPKSCRPSHHHGSVEERDAKGKPLYRSYVVNSVNEDYTEISFCNYRRSSFKSRLSGPRGLSSNDEFKRGSLYQSSKAVRKMKKMGSVEGRKKIELSRSSDTSLSFRIVDSLSQSNEDSPFLQQKRSLVMSQDTSTTCVNNPCMESGSRDFLDLSFRIPSSRDDTVGGVTSDCFVEICLDSNNQGNQSVSTIERGSTEDLNFRCGQAIGPLNSGNGLLKREEVRTLQKSSSEKMRIPHPPFRSEADCSTSSPKARSSPMRRMLDPIMKSKSQRSTLVSIAERDNVRGAKGAGIRRNMALCKSLLHDFSNTVQNTGSGDHFVEKDDHSFGLASSPAHLHGLLKLEYKHGVPLFEFSVKDPEDVLAAKTWKADNAFNWVYTFHSLSNRRKSTSSGWGVKERNKETAMVGQMQVSCYLCTEMRNGGAFDNSVITEFVLYDIARAKKCFAAQETSESSHESITSHKGEGLVMGPPSESNNSSLEKYKPQLRHASRNNHSDASTPYPWNPSDLHPNLEIAAIVVQVPFEKRESFKDEIGAKIADKVNHNSFDLPMVERSKSIPSGICPKNVKVVIPSGTHGLPSADESGGPSPLLDRWRSGGGCDCGGWDMACPLIVFGNPHIQSVGDHLLMGNKALELFLQGSKEKMPALTITGVGEGRYAVDFHAQLSTLQAFSICVAILHGAEASTATGQGNKGHTLQCSSLKMLFEEEVKFLIEAVAEKEKRKVTKRMEEVPQPFVLNPPFSPIARV